MGDDMIIRWQRNGSVSALLNFLLAVLRFSYPIFDFAVSMVNL